MATERRRAREAGISGASRLGKALQALPRGGIEWQAVAAGEIDAVVDYANSNVIMFPLARRAMRDGAVMVQAPVGPGGRAANSILAELSREDYRQVLAGLEAVHLRSGQVLHEEGTEFRYVYFPIDCVICLSSATEGPRRIKTGLVGYEGMAGMSLVFGVEASPVQASVLVAGAALRMGADRLAVELSRCPTLQDAMHRYTHFELLEARHEIACMGFARMEQRVAGLLLMVSDRTRTQSLYLTQEGMAATLHARRVSITLASASLRSRKLIGYSRGTIRILHRRGLEAVSCACYRKAKDPCAA